MSQGPHISHRRRSLDRMLRRVVGEESRPSAGRLALHVPPSALVAWRPTLTVVAGCAVVGIVLWLHLRYGLLLSKTGLAAGLLLLVSLLPLCWLEYRLRCLVGLLPLAALVVVDQPWSVVMIVIVSFLAAWLARRRSIRTEPAMMRQRHLAHHLQRYPLLHKTCLQLATARDADQVAAIIADQVVALADGGLAAAVHLPLRQQRPLQCRARAGILPQPDANSQQSIAFVSEQGRPLQRRTTGRLIRYVPMIDQRSSGTSGDLVAVLEIHQLSAGLLGNRDDLVEALARMGGIALGTADLVAQTRSLALRDSLTGLFGQHEMRQRGEELVAQARRQGQRCAVIMCDLDHLKMINDRYGHSTGDQALLAVAHQLRQMDWPQARAGRWGGEEFVVLLPQCSCSQAEQVAEALRETIATMVCDEHHPQLRITASVGVAEARPSEGFIDVVARADAACYQAKSAGRNCLRVAS